jgi:hypothetical protein
MVANAFVIRVFLVGSRPLLMPLEKGTEQDGGRGVQALAAETVIRNEAGVICLPAKLVLEALCGAVGHATPSWSGAKVGRHIEVVGGEFVSVLRPDGDPVTDEDWEPDTQPGRNSGNMCALTRAKFPEWAVLVEVRVTPSDELPKISAEYLCQLFKYARGFGAFRREFGHFVVAEGGWVVTAAKSAA